MAFDWRIAIVILQSLTIVVTVTSFLVLRLNDLTHVSKDIGEIKKDIKEIGVKLGEVSDAQIKRDVLCDERYGVKHKP